VKRTPRFENPFVAALLGGLVVLAFGLIAVVDSKDPGDEVELTVLRGSRDRRVKVKLGSRPGSVGTSSNRDPQGELLPPDVAP
jgi:hypothetical protein